MLTDRRQRVLRLMLSVERPLTAAEIGRQVECPAHSVRYDLEALGQWVCRLGGQLISTAGVGYHLTGDLDRLRWALDQFTQSSVHEYVLSPRERVRRLLLRLLADSHHHPLQTFADRLRVGKSTVHADLAAVQTWVQARGLALERSNAGVRIDGSELVRRQAMADLVMELADEGQLAMLMEGHPDADALQALLSPMLPGVDWLAIGGAVREAESPQLGVHLAIMISRLASGSALPSHAAQSDPVTGTAEWRLADALATSMQSTCAVPIPATERTALAQYLGASRLTAERSSPDMLTEADLALATAMAIVVQSRLGLVLAQDQDFVVGLAMHLRPVRQRLRRGLALDNPLLREVREKFAAAYRAAEDVARALESQWDLAVPPAEIGYVAIHIAAAMERAKLMHQESPRALLVCGAGIGTAQLLATRLRSSIPDVKVGRTVSAFRVREAIAREHYDLIITTCQVASCGVPVVRVSPLLIDDDLVRIQRVLDTLRIRMGKGRQPVLKEVLRPGNIALDVAVGDWEAAIRAAGALLVKAGQVEERYVDAMVRTARELGPYIVLGPGFALPHARPEDGVKALGIAMVRLRTPVKFGHQQNDPVDLVFALGAVDHSMHLKALMQLSELLGNEQAIKQLRNAPDVAAVVSLIDQASGESVVEG